MTDVAKMAGVSQSTVSLVLNGKASESIPDTTRQKVMDASNALGYRPNALARALKNRDTGVIGFITDELVTTNFAGSIVKGAQDVAWDHHKVLMLVNVDNRKDMIEQAIEKMLSYRVESIVFATMYHHDFQIPDNLGDIPAVLINCFDSHRSVPGVVPDDYSGAYKAVKYLIDNNHQRIAYISNIMDIPATIKREQGYKQCLSDNGIAFDANLLIKTEIEGDKVFRVTQNLLELKNRPTAIFCYNDRCALSVYSAAASIGIKIPKELSVIGYDNQIVLSEFLIPKLTTVQLPHYEMGAWAIKYLFDHKKGYPPINEKIEPMLIIRESVRSI